MIKNNLKTNLIDKLTNNKQNIICDVMLMDKINADISAVLVKDAACNISSIPSIYNGDIRSASINQLQHFDGVILNVVEFSKDEIKIFSQMFENNNISVIYNISNINDIVKIRFLKPKVVIISQNTIQNPVAVKLNIDWECSCILNPKNNISMAYINEYGFSGLYAESFIDENISILKDIIKPSMYLDKLYIKKSSIRPLLKASKVSSTNEIDLCAAAGIDMVSIIFDENNIDNVINLLSLCKHNNKVAALEVYDSKLAGRAEELINMGMADCIENNTDSNSYIPCSYQRASAFSNNINNITPLLVDNDAFIKENTLYTPWLSFMEGEDMTSIIKLNNIELIEFNIQKYNTIDKIRELIKKIKYKQ